MARVEEKILANRYRLDELLGEGAMGSVHLAWDEKEKRKVAIKLLKTETWGNEARARLREEALSLQKLSHKGITKLLDFNEERQRSFLVLEYVEGGNLNQYVAKNHPLPIERVVEMAVELCDALASAHKAGIIHRDLKPDNVLLSASGNVRLTDFGLALRDDRTEQLTATGTIQGTPNFICPEQIKGSKATKQSDIYSLGCVLYFLVTGEQPFKRENITEILQAHLTAQRANARKKRPDCPQALAKIISKAMAVKSAERFKDCQQLKRALLNVGNEKASGLATFKSNSQHPFVNEVKQSNSKGPWPWLLLALLIGLAISFLFVGGETGPTIEPMLRLWPTTVEIDWTLASQSTCQCRLMDGTKTLRTQRVNRSLPTHSFSFRGLTPGQDYKVVLESSGQRKSINFVTPVPQLTSDVLSHAVNGHLFLDFSSNVKSGLTVQYGWLGEEQNSLVINDCKHVRRAFHFNEKSFHANDVVFVSWEVELNGHTLAKGKVQAKQFFTTRWTPLKSTRRRGTLKMPTNVGRTFFSRPKTIASK